MHADPLCCFASPVVDEYDECSTDPCNSPVNRLCVNKTGMVGWTGTDCTDQRTAFTCADSGGSLGGTDYRRIPVIVTSNFAYYIRLAMRSRHVV